MKLNIILIHCSIILFTLLSTKAVAELPPEITDSIVQLKSPRSCGTGFFISPNKLLTTFHYAKNLCVTTTSCTTLSLLKGKKLGYLKKSASEFKLIAASPLFDLAILEFNEDTNYSLQNLSKIKGSSEVFSAGYSGCLPLRETSGNATELEGSWFRTNLTGSYGFSGAPVLDSNYSLIGVIDKSNSIFSSILSVLFGTNFTLRAVNSDLIPSENKSTRENLFHSLNSINNSFNNEISNKHGFSRVRGAYDIIWGKERLFSSLFSSLIEESKDVELINSYNKAALRSNFTTSELIKNPLENYTDLDIALEKLLLLSSFEENGIYESLFKTINLSETNSSLERDSRPKELKEDIQNLLKLELTQKNPGINSFFLINSTLLAPILFLYVFSLGILFNLFKGSVLVKLVKTFTLGAFLWPISFFYVVGKNRREKK